MRSLFNTALHHLQLQESHLHRVTIEISCSYCHVSNFLAPVSDTPARDRHDDFTTCTMPYVPSLRDARLLQPETSSCLWKLTACLSLTTDPTYCLHIGFARIVPILLHTSCKRRMHGNSTNMLRARRVTLAYLLSYLYHNPYVLGAWLLEIL
jgi:hypothetical protein